MSLSRLIYTSTAAQPMKAGDLNNLLEQSRARNGIYGITGLLIYDCGAFLQLLEGERFEVENVFASIERDPRHTRVRVLGREPILAREFESWTMAWADLSHSAHRPIACGDDLPRLSFEDAKTFLRHFRRSAGLLGPAPPL